MTWFKVDDQFHDHGKVRRAGDLAAIGLWTLAGSWCGDNSHDGFVPASVLRRWSGSWKRHAATLVASGLWEAAERDGEAGFVFHDWQEYQPVKADTTTDLGRVRWQRKNALSKDRHLREAVQRRDGSLCRYCAGRVNWNDRRGPTGGTYDHVDPDGPNSLENVVVACRRCNGRKRDRTPTEAGMALLPVPVFEPVESQVGVSSGVGSDLAPPTRDGAESGRVGSGAGFGVESVRVPALPSSNGNGSHP